MADPLSLTLATITLATALKDMIELVQKLNDSLKQPTLNMRKAESLAEDTLNILQVLEKFYDGHKETLDDDPLLRQAVTDLLRDMNLVYEKCGPILDLSNLPKTKVHKIKYAIHSWIHRRDVERDISKLKDRAKQCQKQFMMLTQLGTAAGVVKLRGTVVQGFFSIHEQQSSLQTSDDNILAFMGPTPVVLSKLPPHVQLSERLVYRSYVTVQVGKIDTLFKALAARGSYPIEEPDYEHLQPFRSFNWLKPSNDQETEDVRSDVFALIVKIQESLQGRDNRFSIQRGAQAMSSLSVSLSNLGMNQESLKIVQLAVDLYRTLNKINEDVYGPRLAHALCRMSSCYTDTGNVIEAYKLITEAVTIGRRLTDANPTFGARMQLAYLVSCSASIGRDIGDWENALKDAEEAVQRYQSLIETPKLILKGERRIAKDSRMTLGWTNVYDFTSALEQLHYSLPLTLSRENESVKVGVEALELYRDLEQGHNSDALSYRIASLCLSLASDEYREFISIDQALLYARESVQRYEKIPGNNGVVHNYLPSALGLEIEVLSSLERFDEAYGVCQKLSRMIQSQMDDRKLRARLFLQLMLNVIDSKHYAEAALTGEQLLSMYQNSLLDWELRHAYDCTWSAFVSINNYSKSIQVADASVNHWRTLALQNTKYLQYVARSILDLAQSCLWAKDYERAFKEGGEAIKLHRELITEDSTLLGDYMKALELNMHLATEAKMGLESLERSHLVVQYSRALVKQFPNQLFFIRLIRDYAGVLENFDHLTDASVAISEALDWFDANPAQDSEWAELHTFCLLISARFFRLQGHLDRALSLHYKASTIGQPFINAFSVARNIFRTKTYNLLTSYYMGCISIVLDIEELLNFSLEHNLEKVFSYTFCLETISRLYRCSGRLDDALITIQRSIALDKEDARIPSSWLLSDLLADAGQEAESLTVAHKAMQETDMLKNSPYTFSKELHVQAQYSLALRLFASGELTQAQELLAQVRSFYHEHSKARNLWFINLAIALWALGHLGCASGRHECGIAARSELEVLRKHLRLIFPSLADLVEVGLNREKNFAAWKRLLEKFNLSCGHQDEHRVPDGNAGTTESLGARIPPLGYILATSNSAS